MFNYYVYDRKKAAVETKERMQTKSAQVEEKCRSHRERLYENYTKRISDFILHMEKQPIRIKTYQSPLENAGRTSDPAKFKGKPHIIVREYKTHRERLLVIPTQDSLKYASIHSPSPDYEKPAPLNPINSASAKVLKPKRMYFKPKNNLERVIEELRARHVDLNEYDSKETKKSHIVNRFRPRKTWIALPNFVSEPPPPEKDSESEHSEEIVPKQIFAGLHNKTYFKGVTSLLIQDAKNSMRSQVDLYAEEVLKNCNVKPNTHSQFLRVGGGKLVSNPEETIRDTYTKLRHSMKSI
jgi:hypothetical protein